MSEKTLPKDHYSTRLRELQAANAIEKTTLVDLVDIYGNAESWVIKTIRVDGSDTVFLQRNNADGGDRWVLPPEVTGAISRQRDGVVTVSNKRRARSAAATRKLKVAQGGER
jgi:hypothetical protein